MTKDEEEALDECLEAEECLTKWELDFLDNLDKNYRKTRLSPRQSKVLMRINEKILGAYDEDIEFRDDYHYWKDD